MKFRRGVRGWLPRRWVRRPVLIYEKILNYRSRVHLFSSVTFNPLQQLAGHLNGIRAGECLLTQACLCLDLPI
jgi:hypothetical protein